MFIRLFYCFPHGVYLFILLILLLFFCNISFLRLLWQRHYPAAKQSRDSDSGSDSDSESTSSRPAESQRTRSRFWTIRTDQDSDCSRTMSRTVLRAAGQTWRPEDRQRPDWVKWNSAALLSAAARCFYFENADPVDRKCVHLLAAAFTRCWADWVQRSAAASL